MNRFFRARTGRAKVSGSRGGANTGRRGALAARRGCNKAPGRVTDRRIVDRGAGTRTPPRNPVDKTTLPRTLRLATATGTVLMLCFGLAAAWNWWQARQVPDRAPDAVGRVVRLETFYERPHLVVQAAQGGQVNVTIVTGTHVRRRSGEDATVALGQRISVWHDGIVYATFPATVHAKWLIVEEDEGQPQP